MRAPIGILGGTFDPVHLGHIYVGRKTLKILHLRRVIFALTRTPKHRAPSIAKASDRLALLKLAIAKSKLFTLDSSRRNTYAINTLRFYRRKFPHTPLCFILGWDSFITLRSWHKWHNLIKFAHFIVVCRGKKKQKFPKGLQDLVKDHKTNREEDLKHYLSGKIYFLSITPIAISATDIRRRVKARKPIAELVSKKVAAYIHTHLLYD